MKTKKMIATLVVALLSVTAVAAKDFRTVVFKVAQMECANCERKVKNNIKFLILTVDMNCVILKTDKANNKHMAFSWFGNREPALFGSCHTVCSIHPKHIGTGNGFSGIVFYNSRHLCL